MTPYCRRLIDVSKLTSSEVRWIDTYHERVRVVTKTYFDGSMEGAEEGEEVKAEKERALRWLMRETEKLGDAKR